MLYGEFVLLFFLTSLTSISVSIKNKFTLFSLCFRRLIGLTQSDLGALIDMEKSNISTIENGRQNPSTLTLKKIADAIGC